MAKETPLFQFAPFPGIGESGGCIQLCKIGIESVGIKEVASQLQLAMKKERDSVSVTFFKMWLAGQVDTIKFRDT